MEVWLNTLIGQRRPCSGKDTCFPANIEHDKHNHGKAKPMHSSEVHNYLLPNKKVQIACYSFRCRGVSSNLIDNAAPKEKHNNDKAKRQKPIDNVTLWIEGLAPPILQKGPNVIHIICS
jgi:hypothetical protein